MAKKSTERTSLGQNITKEEALVKIARQVAEIKQQLERSRIDLKAALKPKRYSMNFQVNAFRKEINYWKGQATRLKLEPITEVDWAKQFGS
jgi:hypothetical protein